MRCLLSLVLVFFLTGTARAELVPEEVAVIAMAKSEQSRQLAEYYAKARGVPESQIFLLQGKPGRSISREVWQEETRPAIRAWLTEKGLDEKIRCLVTCWDVPLRIGKRNNDAPEVVARRDYLARSRASRIKQYGDLVKMLDSLAPGDKPPERPALDSDIALKELAAQFESALKAAQERLKALDSEEETKRAGTVFERVFVTGGGINGLLQSVFRGRDPSEMKPQAARQLDLLRGQLLGLSEGLQVLGSLPDTVARDVRMLGLIQKTGGLLGVIGWIDQQQQMLQKNETHSSFDSELSLLHWPDYSLFQWQPNLLHYRFDNLPLERPTTLMVSRLEAPTFELAKNLIDTAIVTEKTGLTGKVYLDARGIKFDPKKDKPGSYGQYDQSLRDLAKRLAEHTKLEVVLDDEAKLFQEGDCPDAALYCGWYSLAKYVDAFDWRPGSVGYHLASSEATTLRTPGSKVWCNAMLEDGICASLGPVHEPYLASFPLPDDFFPLLLSGRYTLVEVYYRTKPYNSWAMVLVGDPLYNPFKHKPPLGEDALPERMKQTPPAGSQ